MGTIHQGPNERLDHWAREEPLLDDNTSHFESTEYGVGDYNTEQGHEGSSAGHYVSSSKKSTKRKKAILVDIVAEELQNVKYGTDGVATALSGGTSNLQSEKQLYEEILKIGDMSDMS
ncbi:hypothetical protein TorRG33x02_339460 [Trema orientale]|uniref:Uncharacterized protein n=1 Tax=Trema orientale TaxID=63057 RepID=A0A2P5AWF2_TREOI|nr:hypothetical protein TorRG33x02_339460 [Trema orientale]